MSEMIKNAAEAPLGMEETSVASESVVVQTVSVPPVRKKHKISKGDRIFEGIVYTILAIWTLVTIYPLIYVLSCSISPPEDVYMGRVFLFPTSFDFSSYAKVLSADMIWRGYLNTIIYVVVGTLISCALTIPAGYVLSRKDFRPRGVLMTIFMITMFFSGGMIPTFLVVKSLGLMNKMLGFILPGALSVWNVIVVRTFMSSSIAWEIQEAASAPAEAGAMGRTRLLELLPGAECYYPLPDYRAASEIYSDGRLPGKGDLTGMVISYDYPQFLRTDVGASWDKICQEGSFREFANSYLMVWRRHG